VLTIAVTDRAPWDQCASRGGQVIVFLTSTGRHDLSWAADAGGAVYVNKDVAFYDLTRPHDSTYDIRMRRLVEPAQILAAVRAAAQFKSNAPVEVDPGAWNWVSLPLLRDGVRDAQGAEILLPLDERTEALAEEWEKSPDPQWRLMAIRAARGVDTKRSRALIARLLDDPAYFTQEMQGWDSRIDWRRHRVYFVRQAAWESMSPRPPGVRPVLEGPDAGLYVRPGAWKWAALAAGIVVGVALAAWAGRRRRSWSAAAAVLSLELAMLTIWLCAWSRGRIDSVEFATTGSEHVITSAWGSVMWLRVQDDPGRRPIVIRSDPGWSPTGAVWFSQYLAPQSQKGTWGVSAASGKTATPGYGVAAYPFYLLQVRYSLLIGALCAWPALFGIAIAARRIRRRFWSATGRCPGCGYDLRSAQGPCPECGAARDVNN
jgi:hypothetical protein